MQTTAMLPDRQKCSFGCPILDRTLNGGVPCGCVTEITGESSSAKTQLCLQLSLAVQLPERQAGLLGSALYIYTENYFPSSRLRQLARPQSLAARENHRRGFVRRRPLRELDVNTFEARESPGAAKRKQQRSEVSSAHKLSKIEGERDAFDPCKNVYVQGLQTAEQLVAYLDRAEILLSRPLSMPVRLLVIDSIAALFRADFDHGSKNLAGRSALFFTITSKLKRIAETYNVAVVVTNHVIDYFEPVEAVRKDPAPGTSPIACDLLITSGRRVAPALGISWAQCVNLRLFLSRSSCDSSNATQRSMLVVFAPHVPNSSIRFVVDEDGVRGVLPHDENGPQSIEATRILT